MPYLKKSNPTAQEIRDELTSVFATEFGEGRNAEFLEACVKIGAFLAHTASVDQQLKELDTRLGQGAGNDLERVIEHYRQRAGAKPLEAGQLDDALRHLLARELTTVEIQNGFNTFHCINEERVQTYVAFVSAESFRAQLKLGRHWKDPGVPGMHGEYTHRIQWFLLVNALGHDIESPVKLFMQIGAVVDPNESNKPHGLWDALFDRNDGSASTKFEVQATVTDARSPESLTHYIVADGHAEKWPLLHWYIKARLHKRQLSPLNQYAAAKAYVEKKIKKFGLETESKDVVGSWRQFGSNKAPPSSRPASQLTGPNRFERMCLRTLRCHRLWSARAREQGLAKRHDRRLIEVLQSPSHLSRFTHGIWYAHRHRHPPVTSRRPLPA